MAGRPPRRSALATRSPFEAPEAAEAPVAAAAPAAAESERAIEAPAAAPVPALALVPQEQAAEAPAAAPATAPQVQSAPVAPAQPAAALAPTSTTAELPKKKQSFYLEEDEANQMRGAYRATAHLEGFTSLTDLIARAVATEVHRLQVQHNGGRPFPSLGANQIPKGRPLSS